MNCNFIDLSNDELFLIDGGNVFRTVVGVVGGVSGAVGGAVAGAAAGAFMTANPVGVVCCAIGGAAIGTVGGYQAGVAVYDDITKKRK